MTGDHSMTKPQPEKTAKAERATWRKPELVRLGTIRDIAQQGPPFSQGNRQFS